MKLAMFVFSLLFRNVETSLRPANYQIEASKYFRQNLSCY